MTLATACSRDEAPSNDDEGRLDRILYEHHRARAAGAAPSPEELARQYPELADRILRALEDERVIDELAGGSFPGAARGGENRAGADRETPPLNGAGFHLPRGIEIAGHLLMEELGRGGMGIVYRARHLKLGRDVALKVVRGGVHADPELRDRFLVEARAAAALAHPNIVPVHEVGEHDGLPFLTMRLIDGECLARRFHRGPVEPGDLARIVEAIARAAHFAHAAGIVHRDLKPSNILFDGGGVPHVTDFGLAKHRDDARSRAASTATGARLGALDYIPPEQARGQIDRIGPAADIYSLGAILYEGLTRRPPFRSPTEAETLMGILHEEPLPPRRLEPLAPRDLETIALKCLEKEPARRYPSALELAEDLRRFLEGAPIEARPSSPMERAAKWARRRPAMAALLALALAVAVGYPATLVHYTLKLRESEEALAGKVVALDREGGVVYEQKRAAERIASARHLFRSFEACVAGDFADAWRNFNRPIQGDSYDGFAFEHFYRMIAGEHRSKGFGGSLRSVDLSPDGAILAGGGARVPLFAGDWQNFDEIQFLFQKGESSDLAQVGFTGRQDEVVILGRNGELSLTRPVSGLPPRPLRLASTKAERFAVIAPESGNEYGESSPRLALLESDGRLRIWSLDPTRARAEIPVGDRRISAIAASRDRRRLAAGAWDGAILIFDVQGEAPAPLAAQDALASGAHCLALSDTGDLVASAREDGSLRIWNWRTGEILTLLPAHPPGDGQGAINCLAYSPDDQWLASAGEDRLVRIWDTRSGAEIDHCQGHNDPIQALLFHPRAPILISAGDVLHYWDLDLVGKPQGFREPFELTGLPFAVTSVHFSNGQAHCLALGDELEWIDYAVREVRAIPYLVERERGQIPGWAGARSRAVSADGSTLAVATAKGVVEVWRIRREGPRTVWTLEARRDAEHRLGEPFVDLALTRDGGRLAAGLLKERESGEVRIWEVAELARNPDAKPAQTFPCKVAPERIRFSPDGKLLAISRRTKTSDVLIQALGSAQPPACFEYQSDGAEDFIFHPTQRYLLRLPHSGADIILVRLPESIAGAELHYNVNDYLNPRAGNHLAAAISPDGLCTAVGGDDGSLHLLDVFVRPTESLPLTQAELRSGREPIRAMAFSPDGRMLAVGGGEGKHGVLRLHRSKKLK